MRHRVLISKMLVAVMLMTTCLNFTGVFHANAAVGNVLQVGPGKAYATPQAAFDAASPGDTIEIDASGVYETNNAKLSISDKDNITIKGVNGRPLMKWADPSARLAWGKSIWLINASNITIENIEFQGATCSDLNGAGISLDGASGGTVLLKNCYFHNNDDGIMSTVPGDTVDLIIEGCEFSYNALGNGLSHNMYIGRIRSFTLKNSYSHHVKGGHLVKSRALVNNILYNRITDEDANSIYFSTYNVDLSNGGYGYVIGNIFQQGVYAENNGFIGYAGEGKDNPGKNLYIINNTFVNDFTYATFIRGVDDSTYTITSKNNIFAGPGAIRSGSCNWVEANNLNKDPGFVNRNVYDYRLADSAAEAINKGIDPGTSAEGIVLMPVSQYAHKCGVIDRSIEGSAIDIGAYEHGAVLPTPSIAPSPTPTPTPTPSPVPTISASLPDVFYSKANWGPNTYNLGSTNTEALSTVEFDFTPFWGKLDATICFADTSSAITHWRNCGVILRMNADGLFDAINGTASDGSANYSKMVDLPYNANSTYHGKLVIHLDTKVFDAYITPPGGTETQLASGYAFRKESNTMDDIGQMALMSNAGDNLFYLKNLKINGVVFNPPAPSPTPSPRDPLVISVGPGKTYTKIQDAVNAAMPGDIIEIDATGVYTNDTAITSVLKDNLTFRGVNGRPKLEITSGWSIPNRKGIFTIAANNTVIENLELTGAHDTGYGDKNWAGIRVDDIANLTVKNCYIHNNDDGILGGGNASSNLLVENCEFEGNAYDDHSHNLYISNCKSFTMRYSYSHRVKYSGHLVKTRAQNNYIEYNRITDEDTSSTYNSNSNIDIPDAGNAYIIGNIMHQGTTVGNSRMISYGVEDAVNSGREFYLINNTMVNDYSSGTFIQSGNIASKMVYKNNIFQGAGSITNNSGGPNNGVPVWTGLNNLENSNLTFADKGRYDYHLTASCAGAIDMGIDPGTSTSGYSLAPVKEYVHPLSNVARTVKGSAIDIGAYEFDGVVPTPFSLNLALNKPVACSDEAKWDGVASKVNDGDSNSGWYTWTTTYPQWVRIDLTGLYTIGQTEIEFNSYTADSYMYKIEVSTDDTNYTTVVDKTSNTDKAAVLTDTFNAVVAKYVRLTVTGCSNAAHGVRVNEFRVLMPQPGASPTVSPSPTPSLTPSATPSPSGPRVLTVGPGKQYAKPQDAINAAVDGDVIEIYADGVYYGADAYTAVNKNNITIKGMGGCPKMEGNPAIGVYKQKGIWVVSGNNVTIENIEFTKAHDTSSTGVTNCSGIRTEPIDGLVLRNCYFHDDDNGILAAGNPDGVMTVESCEFGYNGHGDGSTHNIYVNNYKVLNFRYNYSHDCTEGHLLKTRALSAHIEYNCLMDQNEDGIWAANSNIDMSNAGTYYLIGNIFQQNDGGNWRMLSYGVEGASNAGKDLYVINNTFVSEVPDLGGTSFIQLVNDANLNIVVKNNIFTGNGDIVKTLDGTNRTAELADGSNLINADPGYADRANYDFHLTSASAAVVDKGVNPGVSAEGYSLVPSKEYTSPCSFTTRTMKGIAIDIGAYEYDGVVVQPTPSPTPSVAPSPTPSVAPSPTPINAPFISVPFPKAVDIGQLVTVTVNTGKVTDLYAYDLTFQYDTSIFDFVSGQLVAGTGNFQLLSQLNDDDRDGKIRILATLTGNIPGISGENLPLVSFVFRAKAAKGTGQFAILAGANACSSTEELTTTGDILKEPVSIINCDVNDDGKYDILDIVRIAKAFGKKLNEVGYSPELDINNDGIIDIYDMTYVALKVLGN